MTERTYTLDEANAALPEVKAAVERIRDARQVVFRHGERIRKTAVRNGGGPEGTEYLEALRILRTDMERLAEDGVILRDAESGLLDFPSERDGRTVYLCWRFGEDAIGYWHEPDTGFAGRRPL
ncbi:MAG: DUF2203 domain-containing protein [Actinobacteria bacterium]|nr:DUF2203 domain-containing protein [Actinomycetota bacterium]